MLAGGSSSFSSCGPWLLLAVVVTWIAATSEPAHVHVHASSSHTHGPSAHVRSRTPLPGLHPSAPQSPEQLHLVFGASADTYIISWVSFASPTPNVSASVVQWGTAPDRLDRSATAQPTVFIEKTCKTPRTMHTVSMTGLVADMAYFYRVNSASGSGPWSPIFMFVVVHRLAPTTEAEYRPQAVAVVGDMGIHCKTSSLPHLANDTYAQRHDFVVHFGDIGYNLDDACNTVGDQYMNDAQVVGAYTAFIYGVGNHETEDDCSYDTFLKRYASQTSLAAASGSPSVRWLSFESGLVHYIMFDTDAWVYREVIPLAKPQLEWMRADLAKVDRNRTPWIVVFGHRAMYCTKSLDAECNEEAEALRVGWANGTLEGLEALFLQYSVDLFVAGHSHHAMRTWPVARGNWVQKNYLNPRGIVHVQNGLGGVDDLDTFDVPMRDRDAWRDDKYERAYNRLVFHNRTHLTVTQHRAATGDVMDQFVIEQHQHGVPF